MTVQELNNEQKNSHDGNEEIDSTTTTKTKSSNPPPYYEGVESTAASDQNMLKPFEHVVIPPSAPAPDGNAIDIRVDDDGEAFTQVLEAQPAVHLYITPYRAYRDLISSPTQARCQISAFETVRLTDSQRSVQRSSSISGVSSSDSVLSAGEQASIPVAPPTLPPLTSKDMLEALPSHEAIFLADCMQWVVIMPEEEVRSYARVDDVSVMPPSTSPFSLWKNHGNAHISASLQKKPISTLQHSSNSFHSEVGYLEDFEWWKSNKGGSLLTSQKGTLPSVVPVELMEKLRSERMANPRPGQTGETQFRDSVLTLVRVIANAANGEDRALTINGKTLTTKLGVDDITRNIFGTLGFYGTGDPDANGQLPMISPPNMRQGEWQLKLRRAWLEISLWYQYMRVQSMANCPLLPEVRPSIPLVPTFVDSNPFMANSFNFDQSSQVQSPKVFISPTAKDAFELIGAEFNAVEALIDDCYVANTHNLSLLEKVPFYAALQTVGQYFIDTEGDQVQTRLGIEKSHGLFSEADLKGAYAKIGIEIVSMEQARDIDDEFLISVYSSAAFPLAAKKQEVQLLKDALEIISASRGHPKEIEEQLSAPVELTVSKAYEILGLTNDIDDDFVSSVFAVVSADGSKSSEECIEALRVIAEARNSTALRRIYRSAIGEPEEWEAPDLEKPIGLNNIGNTCYLNSVLQYFFAIRQLRDHVILASRSETEMKLSGLSMVRVGGRQVTVREIERSHQFVRQLAQLFSNMISSPASAVTPERELAYLALVSSRVEETNEVADVETSKKSSTPAGEVASMQISNNTSGTSTEATLVDEPTEMTISDTDKEAKVNLSESSTAQNEDQTKEIKSLPPKDEDGFTTPPLPTSQAPPLPPRPMPGAFDLGNEVVQRRNSLMQLGAQQDVSECLDNVMFQVEVALTAKEQEGNEKEGGGSKKIVDENDDGWIENGDLLRRLFLGRTLQRLELVEQEDTRKARGPSIHTKREVFTILPIDVVEEGRDLYDGLDGFFDEEILIGSGGEPIRRTVTLMDAPAIMQIQLQRVQFDRIKGAYKSQAHLEIGQTMFMDRYLDFNPLDEEDVKRLEKRKKGREARKRIENLRARARALVEPEKSPISKILKQTSEFLTSLDGTLGTNSTTIEGGSEEEQKRNELRSLCDSGFNQFLEQEATRVDEELQSTEKEILELKSQVEELWKGENRYEYVLASVFMHRGEASHGHYFLNQRRLTEKDKEPSTIWYKYNDQSVTEVKWNEVHRDQSGATPYLLCWVRKDKLDHFDSLCREYEVPLPTVEDNINKDGEGAVKLTSEEVGKGVGGSKEDTINNPQDDVIMTDITPPS